MKMHKKQNFWSRKNSVGDSHSVWAHNRVCLFVYESFCLHHATVWRNNNHVITGGSRDLRRGLDIGSGFLRGRLVCWKNRTMYTQSKGATLHFTFFDLNMGSCSLFKAISVEVKMRRLIHFRSNLYSCLRKANGNYLNTNFVKETPFYQSRRNVIIITY